ncbi:MAG: hypothetical protein K2X47_14985 [Bdellovibrionales bacterium]|nr:hypothetical protein [Bdellovibrionales bacterium]
MKYVFSKNFFALSILAHTFFALVLSLLGKKIPEIKSAPVEVQILTVAREKHLEPASSGESRQTPSKKNLGASKKVLRDLFSSTAIKFGAGSSLGASGGAGDPSGEPWGSRSTSLDSLENTLFYKTIYEAIDDSVYYPAVLAKRKIDGSFQARLTFDAVDGCLWKKAKISEGNPHLRLFVLDLLRRACANETVRRLRPLRTVTADLSFLFAIGEPTSKFLFEKARRQHGPLMIGNVLMFEAHSVQSVMTWNLGPFTGVFPIPYVGINFEWLQENWDKVVNGQIKPSTPVR